MSPCGGNAQPFRDSNGRNLQCGTATGTFGAICPPSKKKCKQKF